MFQTDDIYLVGALAAKGVEPKNIERDNGRAQFSFGDDSRPVMIEYYGGSLLLPASSYAACIRTAKKLAMSAKPAAADL